MEKIPNFSEDLQKCPYHQMLHAQDHDENNADHGHQNTGDWGEIDEQDEAGTDPNRNQKTETDNPAGTAGSGQVTNT
ncbi:hypothetical protein [Flavobacterium hungaricum]|uniref:Uncharacterized protein n=1 Tax=Flavobacterium hungaricum TaxID=2082725 RepID=A0ABR9TM08_9FLAO|nr:hypothetical protein [Flavobacterium hungaricum]MBE8726407.1 hypothetical protein [Flavobacterium hungaricum]